MISVALVDHPGSGASGADLVALALALERQVQDHFAPIYGISCTVGVVSSPQRDAWTIGLFADADQPGALGYHDLGPNGLPYAKVFPLLDAQDGANLSTTVSHELLEMLADSYLRLAVQSSDGKFYACEACDPVEQDEYEINGVKVSNFVTPSWYTGTPFEGAKFDYLGTCAAALEVRPGGYSQWFDPAQGWRQIVHDTIAPRAYRQLTSGRSARRRGR